MHLVLIPGAARVYPRICPISIPAAGGALRVSGLISFSPWITGNPPPGGMAFYTCFRLVSFVPARSAVPPGGPNPPDGSAVAPASGAPGAQPFRLGFRLAFRENGGGMSLRRVSFIWCCS